MHLKEAIKRQKAEIDHFSVPTKFQLEQRINKPFGWPIINKYHILKDFLTIDLIFKEKL